MKWSISLALGACTVMLSAAAHAQAANVTVYGLIDALAQIARSDAFISPAESGGASGARQEFRGTEDLGSGLIGNFTLEAGFDTGSCRLWQGGSIFGRRPFVGWKTDTLGQLTQRRQYRRIDGATSGYRSTEQ